MRSARRARHEPERTFEAAAGGAVLIALLLAALLGAAATLGDGTQTLIVQAADPAAAAAAALAADALVTRELAIIDAVVVQATPAQRAALARSGEVRRLWEDRPIAVTSEPCPIVGEAYLDFHDRKIKWSVSHQGSTNRWLQALSLTWPEANGWLKKVKFAGHDVFVQLSPGPALTVNGLWHGSQNDRRLQAGETELFEIEFEDDVEPVPGGYALVADFGGGCEARFDATAMACEISSDMLLDVSGDKIKWALTNGGDRRLWLDELLVEWPAENGALEKIKLSGDLVTRDVPPPAFSVDGQWDGDADDRRLDAGQTKELEIQFENDADPLADLYFLEADFGAGCSIVLTPGQGGGTGVTPFAFSTRIGADELHRAGVTGSGVAVAVVDTGIWSESRLKRNRRGDERIRDGYNALDGHRGKDKAKDKNGHGTHLTSLIANSERFDDGLFASVAPDAELVAVQAFDEDGRGSYADVIAGLDWVLANKDELGIRIVNLSFSAEPQSHYWDDPINQAVMALWDAGLVVVASAGNGGPEPMTVGVPGNVPYVITVGAMSDAVTPDDPGDDFLASFSAAGPTFEGFVKPEVVAPGGHLRGIMDKKGRIAKSHPEYHDTGKYFVMSGTSQAAAVVSGVAALLLEVDPSLSPDDLKCRLMASARPAVDENGELAYSIFQQGAGMVHAYDAAASDEWGCANQGLDIGAELAGAAHFGGPANRDADGTYYVEGLEGYAWSGGYMWGTGYLWGMGYMWGTGYLWGTGFLWGDGYLWGTSVDWWGSPGAWTSSLAETMSINAWVPQE